MSYGIIHKALWFFFSLIFIFFYLVQLTARKITASLIRSCDWRPSSFIHHSPRPYDIQYLERCKPELSKIPKHLSIIVGLSTDISAEDLTKIAAYALIMDIDYISFYDVKGKFSLDQVQVPKSISSTKMQNGHFIWSMSGDRSAGKLKYKNGMEKSIEVITLSENDGRKLVADVCRELFVKRNSTEIQETLKDRPSLTRKITESLQKKLNNMPDPDCAIVFSDNMCTYGLLPWHTGFTEFHLVDRYSYFSVSSFAKILYRFSKCEQRFGH